jgi:hypothetical protein
MREIACDESGYEGEKLVDTTTALFAHASIDLSEKAAAAGLAATRRRVGSPATQYKSGHLLREKNRAALRWFLGPDGPVAGHGHVFLVDKAHLLRVRLSELLGGPIGETSPRFLAVANDVLRGKDQPGVVDEFVRVAPALAGARPRVELFRAWLRADPVRNSVLDPLVPALVAAVRFWGPAVIAHDRQTQLPRARIDRIAELSGGALRGVRFLDATSHPRIQLADMLAGTVRRIVEDADDGRPDPALAELARPYVDVTSIRPGGPAPGVAGPEAYAGPAAAGRADHRARGTGPGALRAG